MGRFLIYQAMYRRPTARCEGEAHTSSTTGGHMSSHRFITKSVSTALAVAAISASAAVGVPPRDARPSLAPQEQQVVASRGQSAPTPIRGPVTHVEPAAQVADGSGFDLGDAGIGAGIAGGLMLVAFGSVGLAHRRSMGVAH